MNEFRVERNVTDVGAIVTSASREQLSRLSGSIGSLTREAFQVDPMDPLLGGRNDIVAEGDLQSAFENPHNTFAILLTPDLNEALGYSLSLPIGSMYPERSDESSETSYIYFTVLHPSIRGKKIVKPLMDTLFLTLQKKGVRFIERDSVIKNGYADSISRQFKSSIVESHDHERFPEFGPERFFKIDISRYLSAE